MQLVFYQLKGSVQLSRARRLFSYTLCVFWFPHARTFFIPPYTKCLLTPSLTSTTVEPLSSHRAVLSRAGSTASLQWILCPGLFLGRGSSHNLPCAQQGARLQWRICSFLMRKPQCCCGSHGAVPSPLCSRPAQPQPSHGKDLSCSGVLNGH